MTGETNAEKTLVDTMSELESIKSDLDNHSLDIQNKPSAVQAYASEVYRDVKRNVLDPVGRGLRTAVAYPILGQFPKKFREDFAKKHDWYDSDKSFYSSFLLNAVVTLPSIAYAFSTDPRFDTAESFGLGVLISLPFELIHSGLFRGDEFDKSASLYYTVASLPFKGAKKLYSAVSDYVSDVSDRVHDKRHQIDSHNNKEVMQYNQRVDSTYRSLNKESDTNV